MYINKYYVFLLGFLCSFLGGATWGLHEVIMHHYSIFAQKFPHANPYFWDAQISWRNKYVGGDPMFGINNKLIWFTDAKHLLASIFQVFVFLSGFSAIFFDRNSIKTIAIFISICLIGYISGNNIVFNVIFR